MRTCMTPAQYTMETPVICPAVVCLTISYVRDCALVVDMDVQTLGLVIHGAHAVGLDDAVFLGEICFGEGLGREFVRRYSLQL